MKTLIKERIQALTNYLDIDAKEITFNNDLAQVGDNAYFVLTKEEAYQLAEDRLYNDLSEVDVEDFCRACYIGWEPPFINAFQAMLDQCETCDIAERIMRAIIDGTCGKQKFYHTLCEVCGLWPEKMIACDKQTHDVYIDKRQFFIYKA